MEDMFKVTGEAEIAGAIKIKTENPVSYTVTLKSLTGNCKLYSIHNTDILRAMLNSVLLNNDQKKRIAKFLKTNFHQLFGTTTKKGIDDLQEYFDFYYIVKTPVGYGNDLDEDSYFQYHYCIKGMQHYNTQNAGSETLTEGISAKNKIKSVLKKDYKSVTWLKKRLKKEFSL